VALGNVEVLMDALLEAGGVLRPQQVVQEDAHGVHAQTRGPAEFEVDALGVEGLGLPHGQLVDGRSRHEVGAQGQGLALNQAWARSGVQRGAGREVGLLMVFRVRPHGPG
jgi:hypothetical protein